MHKGRSRNNNKKAKKKKNRNKKKRLNKKEALIPLHLNTGWILWCHRKNERNWDMSTFIKIYTIHTIQEFWGVYNNVCSFDNEIFFLMRENVSPMWNTPENKGGGKWNIYINRKKANEVWRDLSLLAIGETLKVPCTEFINGIAIRPKFHQSILKIMTKGQESEINWKKEYNHKEINKIFGPSIKIKFESHIDTVKRAS